MQTFVERTYGVPISAGIKWLVADIGGTNSNFGIFESNTSSVQLLYSIHFKSKQVDDFSNLVQSVLYYVNQKYGIQISALCIAAAGVVNSDNSFCKPTNTTFSISTQLITQKTGLQHILLVNDFEVIGYGISYLDAQQLFCINKGVDYPEAAKVIFGAGTGLGKASMYYSKVQKQYIALPSEGGHTDFVVYSQKELELVQFIQTRLQKTCAVTWENVLSGQGIEHIYLFFHTICKAEEKCTFVGEDHSLHPDEIFKNCFTDESCKETVDFYTKIYARYAKNVALDGLALGGVYIAGGIAAHNVDLFKQEQFMREFVNCGKHESLLAQMPLYVIGDYNVSLYGAAALLQRNCSR